MHLECFGRNAMRVSIFIMVAGVGCLAGVMSAGPARASDPWLAGYDSYYDNMYRGYSPGYYSYNYPSYSYAFPIYNNGSQWRNDYRAPYSVTPSTYVPMAGYTPLPSYTAYHYPGYSGYAFSPGTAYSPSLAATPPPSRSQ
jgi:hypothetical protein